MNAQQILQLEIERNRAWIAELVGALKDFVEHDDTPEPNCACHISPPCNDCIDFGGKRELIENANALIAKHDQQRTKGATP